MTKPSITGQVCQTKTDNPLSLQQQRQVCRCSSSDKTLSFTKVNDKLVDQKVDKASWDDYWKSKSFKRRLIEFARRNYFARIFISKVSEGLNAGSSILVRKQRTTSLSGYARQSILEVGCGSGTYLKMLEQKGYKCYGVDNSRPAITIARRNCKNVQLADIFHLPFKNNSIDIIFNQGVMEHFSGEEFDRILKEFSRVSKRVCIIVPSNLSIWRIHDPIKDDENKIFYSKQNLRKLLKKRFKNVRVRYLASAGFLSICGQGRNDV